jgi:hypothetical protein
MPVSWRLYRAHNLCTRRRLARQGSSFYRASGAIRPYPRSAQGVDWTGKRASARATRRQRTRFEAGPAPANGRGMIRVDTSIWIDHLRRGDATLEGLLEQQRVLAHPFVTGELSLGSLRQREIVLGSLQELPQAEVARDDELVPGASIWTRDKPLLAAAERLSPAAKPVHRAASDECRLHVFDAISTYRRMTSSKRRTR